MKIIKASCWVCGKKFDVKIVSTGRIMSKCWHSYIHPELWGFRWWVYQMLDKKDKNGLRKFKPIFKNKFYKIIGFCKFTRSLIYDIWAFLKRKNPTEVWECPKCC